MKANLNLFSGLVFLIVLIKYWILCGIVYIPPYGSKYSHEDPYLEIHTEYSSYCSDIENVILFGDFNSRTACLDDFVIHVVDDFISKQQNDDTLYRVSMQVLDCLLNCYLLINRRSADPVTNAYAKQLIEFCQSNDLFIINGRLGQDFIHPKLTCKDRSTIDYFICSPKLIEYLRDFNVLDFSPLFSDSHCGVDLMINIKCKTGNQNLNQNHLCDEEKPKLWNSEKANIFTENCNINKIRSIDEKTWKYEKWKYTQIGRWFRCHRHWKCFSRSMYWNFWHS